MRGLGAPCWAWANFEIAPNPCSSQRKFTQASAAPNRIPIPQRQKPIKDTIAAAMAPMDSVRMAMRCWTRWNQFALWEVDSIGKLKFKFSGSFRFPTRNFAEWGAPAFGRQARH